MKRGVITILLLLFTIYRSGYSYINIYPYKVYLDIQKSKSEESIVFYNKTTSPLRYKLSIKDKNLKDVISLYPQIVTLNPGDEKEVKLKVENSWKNLEKREHQAEILVEQLKMPLRDEKGIFIKSFGVEIYPKVKVPLKLYLGETPVKLKGIKNKITNISDREINIEIFNNNKKSKKKDELNFIKSINLKNLEELDLEKELEIKNIKNIEIYEKESVEKIEIL